MLMMLRYRPPPPLPFFMLFCPFSPPSHLLLAPFSPPSCPFLTYFSPPSLNHLYLCSPSWLRLIVTRSRNIIIIVLTATMTTVPPLFLPPLLPLPLPPVGANVLSIPKRHPMTRVIPTTTTLPEGQCVNRTRVRV